MKVIQLLNKIANGEEVPKKIKVFGEEFNYDGYDYYSIHSSSPLMSYVGKDYLRAEMNYDIKIIEEPKGIPEKLKIEQDTPSSNYYIKNEYGTKCALTKHSKIIADKVNELLDYLESKGE